MGDVPDTRDAGSHWVATVEDDAVRTSGPAATAEPGRWLLDEPRVHTFTPSRREATAVDTYCAELCTPSEAAAASGEILDTFTGAGPADLLGHTRVVAAQHTAARRNQSRIWRRRDQACDATSGRLAARANNTLGDAEAAELDAHLSSCLSCQALELRSQRAERAFAAILAAGIDQEATASMGAAVADASPALAASVVDTTRWIPDADAAAAATAEPEDAPLQTPADPRTRRRRMVGAVLACSAVIAATIAAIVLITGSNNSHHAVSSRLAAVHSAPKAHHAARHSAVKSHARARKHVAVVHRTRHAKAHRATTTAPAAATPPPAVTTTPVVSPSTTPVSTPVSHPTTPAPSQPTVSIQQPSLGAVNAPTQKIGSK